MRHPDPVCDYWIEGTRMGPPAEEMVEHSNGWPACVGCGARLEGIDCLGCIFWRSYVPEGLCSNRDSYRYDNWTHWSESCDMGMARKPVPLEATIKEGK